MSLQTSVSVHAELQQFIAKDESKTSEQFLTSLVAAKKVTSKVFRGHHWKGSTVTIRYVLAKGSSSPEGSSEETLFVGDASLGGRGYTLIDPSLDEQERKNIQAIFNRIHAIEHPDLPPQPTAETPIPDENPLLMDAIPSKPLTQDQEQQTAPSLQAPPEREETPPRSPSPSLSQGSRSSSHSSSASCTRKPTPERVRSLSRSTRSSFQRSPSPEETREDLLAKRVSQHVIEALRAENEETRRSFETAIANLTDQHREEIDRLEALHREELDLLTQMHEQSLTALQTSIRDLTSPLKDAMDAFHATQESSQKTLRIALQTIRENTATFAHLQKKFLKTLREFHAQAYAHSQEDAERMAGLHEKFLAQLARQQEAFQTTLQALKEFHTEEPAGLREQIAGLSTQFDLLREELLRVRDESSRKDVLLAEQRFAADTSIGSLHERISLLESTLLSDRDRRTAETAETAEVLRRLEEQSKGFETRFDRMGGQFDQLQSDVATLQESIKTQMADLRLELQQVQATLLSEIKDERIARTMQFSQIMGRIEELGRDIHSSNPSDLLILIQRLGKEIGQSSESDRVRFGANFQNLFEKIQFLERLILLLITKERSGRSVTREVGSDPIPPASSSSSSTTPGRTEETQTDQDSPPTMSSRAAIPTGIPLESLIPSGSTPVPHPMSPTGPTNPPQRHPYSPSEIPNPSSDLHPSRGANPPSGPVVSHSSSSTPTTQRLNVSTPLNNPEALQIPTHKSPKQTLTFDSSRRPQASPPLLAGIPTRSSTLPIGTPPSPAPAPAPGPVLPPPGERSPAPAPGQPLPNLVEILRRARAKIPKNPQPPRTPSPLLPGPQPARPQTPASAPPPQTPSPGTTVVRRSLTPPPGPSTVQRILPEGHPPTGPIGHPRGKPQERPQDYLTSFYAGLPGGPDLLWILQQEQQRGGLVPRAIAGAIHPSATGTAMYKRNIDHYMDTHPTDGKNR